MSQSKLYTQDKINVVEILVELINIIISRNCDHVLRLIYLKLVLKKFS